MSGARARRVAAGVLAAVCTAGGPRAPHSAQSTGASIELRASRQGFRPQQLSLRRGEPAQIALSTLDAEHCFAIDALRIEKRIVPGRVTRLEITPERAGSFEFYCCLESGEAARLERGRLSVVD